MPRKVFGQIRKSNCKQEIEPLSVVLLSLTNREWSEPKQKERLRSITEEAFSAEIIEKMSLQVYVGQTKIVTCISSPDH